MKSPSGGSILITSAPRSASIRVQYGPETMVVKSSTRTPPRASSVIPETCPGHRLASETRSRALLRTRKSTFEEPANLPFDCGQVEGRAVEEPLHGYAAHNRKHHAGKCVHVDLCWNLARVDRRSNCLGEQIAKVAICLHERFVDLRHQHDRFAEQLVVCAPQRAAAGDCVEVRLDHYNQRIQTASLLKRGLKPVDREVALEFAREHSDQVALRPEALAYQAVTVAGFLRDLRNRRRAVPLIGN